MKFIYFSLLTIFYIIYVNALDNDKLIKQCVENYKTALSNPTQLFGFNFNLCSKILSPKKELSGNNQVKNIESYKQRINQIRKNKTLFKKRDDAILNQRQESNNDDSCNVAEFGECAIAINLRSAETLCKNDSKCPESLMEKYKQCYKKIYNNTDDVAILDQPYYKTLGEVGLSYSFICSKSGDEWCYDTYKNALTNSTLMHDFMCSDCGEVAYSKYKAVYDEFSDLNEDQSQKAKQFMKEYNTCSRGESINNFINITSLILVSLITIFLTI